MQYAACVVGGMYEFVHACDALRRAVSCDASFLFLYFYLAFVILLKNYMFYFLMCVCCTVDYLFIVVQQVVVSPRGTYPLFLTHCWVESTLSASLRFLKSGYLCKIHPLGVPVLWLEEHYNFIALCFL